MDNLSLLNRLMDVIEFDIAPLHAEVIDLAAHGFETFFADQRHETALQRQEF